jgi:hypothetical protein
MSDIREEDGSNATGNQAESAVTEDVVDSGQSEDIQSSLNDQGSTDRETVEDIAAEEKRTLGSPDATPLSQ